MDKKEKAYCKHDLNVLFGNEVQKVEPTQHSKTEVSSMYGMMCDELVFSEETINELVRIKTNYDNEKLNAMLGCKYLFTPTKSELEEYAEDMKRRHELFQLDHPAELQSFFSKVLYTENLFDTLKYYGFSKIVNLLGGYSCVALNGFDGSYYDTGILQIGSFGFVGTKKQHFESFPILAILQESWGYHSGIEKETALKLADKEYANLIEEEKRLGRFMASLDVYAIIDINAILS